MKNQGKNLLQFLLFHAGQYTLLEAIAERESIYRNLAQTKPDNTSKDFFNYSVDPSTRCVTFHEFKEFMT